MTFDRVVSVLALLVALTGGIPTLINFLDETTYFEVISAGAPEIAIRDGSFVALTSLKIINSAENPVTVFSVAYLIVDKEENALGSDWITFWSSSGGSPTDLPARLGPSDSTLVTIPVEIGWESALPSDLTIEEIQIEATRIKHILESETLTEKDKFVNAFFDEAGGYYALMRGACDDQIMLASDLTRCLRIRLALSEKRTVDVGEIGIAFLEQGEIQ